MPAFTPKSYTLLAIALFVCSKSAPAQIVTAPDSAGPRANAPSTLTGHTKIRALAVVEFTGEKPLSSAYRLVPISIFENGRYRDAQIYDASPAPIALEPGTIYEIQDSGKPLAYATVQRTGQKQLAASDFTEWYGIGSIAQTAPDAELKSAAPAKIVFHDKDESHRVYMPEDKKKRGRHKDDPNSGRDKNKDKDKDTSTSKPASTPTDTSSDDSDRPTLKRRPSANDSDSSATASTPTSQPEMPPAAVESDPSRPKLSRGKPPSAPGAVPETVEFKDSNVRVLPAVSDPNNKESRTYHYDFNVADEKNYRAKLLALAVAEAHRKMPSLTLSPAALEDINLRAFDLSVDNTATLVLTATAPGTPQPRYLTLVARVNLDGELTRTFFEMTDRDRFDISPRMQLVDAVDADGDGRGELLFRLQSAQGEGWGIYRATHDGLRKLFDNLPPSS